MSLIPPSSGDLRITPGGTCSICGMGDWREMLYIVSTVLAIVNGVALLFFDQVLMGVISFGLALSSYWASGYVSEWLQSTRLQGQIDVLRLQNGELGQTAVAHTAANKAHQELNAELERRVVSLATEIEQMGADHRIVIQEYTGQNTALSDNNSALAAQLAALGDTNAQLQASAETFKAESEALRLELEGTRSEMNGLKQTLGSMDELLKIVQGQLPAHLVDKERLVKLYTEQAEKLNEQVERHKVQLQQAETTLSSIQVAVQSQSAVLEETLKTLTEARSERESSRTVLRKEQEAHRAHIEQYVKELERIRAEQQTEKAALDALRSEIEQQRQDLVNRLNASCEGGSASNSGPNSGAGSDTEPK